jgi:hypothetical protein
LKRIYPNINFNTNKEFHWIEKVVKRRVNPIGNIIEGKETKKKGGNNCNMNICKTQS